MPGNRALYDRAMEQSREAARLKNWDESLKQAVRALHEFPQDSDARSSAAVALFNTGKYPQALQVFEELRGSDTNNPFFLEYIARVHEQMGNRLAALGAYRQLVELQQSRRLLPRAVDALHDVLRLQPDADDDRLRLARMLEELGNRTAAVAEYMQLASNLQAQGKLDAANGYAEQALRLDPSHREAKEFIGSLHAAMAEAADAAVTHSSDEPMAMPLPTAGMTGALRSQQFALEKIVALAQEAQEAGDMDTAVAQYERAVQGGFDRTDVFYSLGLLYQERGDQRRAADMLQRAAHDPEYALSAHYALGTAYKELGQLQQAAQEFEHTLRLVDLQSIGKAESEDLIQMFESAAGIYTELNDVARAASLYSTLANFFQGKRWGKELADEFRRKAKELTDRNMFAKLRLLGTGALTAPEPPPPAEEAAPAAAESMPETWGKIRPITDFLRPSQVAETNHQPAMAGTMAPAADSLHTLDVLPTLPQQETHTFAPMTRLDTNGVDEEIERYVQTSEKYVEQGFILAALDLCMEVIRLNPDYLPIHLRMGEIYERDGRLEDALAKYQLLIDTYTVRNEGKRAIDVYYRLIELSPDTTNARAKLADLLKQAGRTDEALEQSLLVAGAYFRIGQTNKALEEYRQILQWAPKSAKLRAQYGQALLKLERYEAALGEFRQALELDKEDVAGVARINMTLALMGDQPGAVWQSLDTLLKRLKAQSSFLNEVLAEYRAALIVSDVGILHYILGIILQNHQQHQSALLELEQARDLLAVDEDPMLPAVLVHQALADSYIALGQANEALEQLRAGHAVANHAPPLDAQSRYPFSTPLTQGELVRRMAEAYAASDDLDGAEQALQQAKQLLPYDRAIYTKLADVYFRQGKLNEALTQLDELATYYEERQDLDKAIETLEYGAQLAPNNIANGRRLAQLCMRRGYLDRGLDGLSRVAELQRKAGQMKDAVSSLQQAAEVYWTLGQQEQARAMYDRIVRIAPNDLDARNWLSLMYTLAGRTRDAINEKKQIVRIALQQRDLDNAIAELHQIIALDQTDSEPYYQLADVLMRRGEYEQALRLYGRLAKMPNIETERVEALQAAAKRMLQQQQQTPA